MTDWSVILRINLINKKQKSQSKLKGIAHRRGWYFPGMGRGEGWSSERRKTCGTGQAFRQPVRGRFAEGALSGWYHGLIVPLDF
jgi:hypothetical protein